MSNSQKNKETWFSIGNQVIPVSLPPPPMEELGPRRSWALNGGVGPFTHSGPQTLRFSHRSPGPTCSEGDPPEHKKSIRFIDKTHMGIRCVENPCKTCSKWCSGSPPSALGPSALPLCPEAICFILAASHSQDYDKKANCFFCHRPACFSWPVFFR